MIERRAKKVNRLAKPIINLVLDSLELEALNGDGIEFVEPYAVRLERRHFHSANKKKIYKFSAAGLTKNAFSLQ